MQPKVMFSYVTFITTIRESRIDKMKSVFQIMHITIYRDGEKEVT
jgi:hypothetical protein